MIRQSDQMTDEEILNKLAKLPRSQWYKLFALIPDIESKKDLGRWIGFTTVNNVTRFPHFEDGVTMTKFLETIVEMELIVVFDWSHFDEGRKLLQSGLEDADIVTLCKILTAIVRNDRFCDGALAHAMENGTILNILKAMQSRVKDSLQK